MKKVSITLFFCAFILIFPSITTAEEDENVCVDCHESMEDRVLTEPVKRWSVSVHKKAGVVCVDCHGGDPTSFEDAMEERNGFTGKPQKEQIPYICGNCHSDINVMRKFNIRTDQLSAYKTSKHGIKLLKEGDKNAASCIDCHNAHDILSTEDPVSTVYRFNVPETCEQCHGNKELMKQYNIPTNQYDLYKNSSHGKKLFEEENLRVPTCPDCHGVHGAAPPGVQDVSFVCDNCHGLISEYYRESPHWAEGNVKKKAHCVDCHGNHDIHKPTIEKFAGSSKKDCGGCHEENSTAKKVGLSIKEKIIQADASVAEVKGLLTKLKKTRGSGFETVAMEKQIGKAETKIKETVPITHSLSFEKVSVNLDQAMNISVEVKKELEAKFVDIHNRWALTAAAWVFILVVVYLLKKFRESL